MAHQTRAEPMNASPNHSKVKVSIALGDTTFVAGTHVSGKMAMECKADKGLGINVVMLELYAIQELTSRDHSATSTFLHSRRMFQGPGLPPSNAVQAHPLPGDTPLPPHYYQARKGTATFLFKFPLPASSPAAISFGSGLARVRYELRASVGVAWKGEKRLVTDRRELDVVEGVDEAVERQEPEGVVVGENGKIWMQATVVGGMVIAGESACVELQVRNHSNKKNSGLSLALTRSLHLSGVPPNEKTPLQLSDTLTTVAFRGPEYIIPPGGEGVANLVFDVPKHARGVKGGQRVGEQAHAAGGNHHVTDCLFEVRCIVSVKMSMGIGSKDIYLDLPVVVVHPLALPELPPPEPYYGSPYDERAVSPFYAPPPVAPFMEPQGGLLSRSSSPYLAERVVSPYRAMSPYGYIDQGQVWLPPPASHTPIPYGYYGQEGQQHYAPPPAHLYANVLPPIRPTSAGSHPLPAPPVEADGKGERASRIAQNLHQSSRNRSVSPQAHRYAAPAAAAPPPFVANTLPPSTSSLRESVQETSPIVAPVAAKPLAIPTKSPPTTTLRAVPLPQSPPSTSSLRALSDTDSTSHIPPQSLTLATQDLPSSQSNHSLSPAVHSPRPVLSPKQSYTDTARPKSERVEDLERMADLVTKHRADLSGDIPKEGDIQKTLPGPPVPTGKETSLLSRTRVETVFLNPEPTVEPAATTPPQPKLRPLDRTESGLDALERKLLAQVGTHKMDLNTRPDVRSVVSPIAIPSKPEEPLNDSAISSLTLAEHDKGLRVEEDERTHKPTKSTKSGDGREGAASSKEKEKASRQNGRSARAELSTLTDKDKERESERRRKRKKDKAQDVEAQSQRKIAKGRVAEWLGTIEPDPIEHEVIALPPIEPIPEAAPQPKVRPVSTTAVEKKRSKPEVAPKPSPPKSQKPVIPPSKPPPAIKPVAMSKPMTSEPIVVSTPNVRSPESQVASAPNPRSSGFMPIGTMRKEIAKRPTAREAVRAMELAMKANANNGDPETAPQPRGRQIPVQATAISPDSATWAPLKKSPSATPNEIKPPVNLDLKAPLRLPPPLDPEVKYDIRSARGGRGGKVTSVASLWASGAIQGETNAQESKALVTRSTSKPSESVPALVKPVVTPKSPAAPVETPKFPDLAGRRPKPMVKSMSIPAMMSPSVATPTLSSTASLAMKVPTAATSPREEIKTSKSPPPLAFGQTRLRDLIMKYQGQSTNTK